MDFLVQIDVTALHHLPVDQREEVIRLEQQRGRELHEQGILRQIWRLPGKRANIGVWSADSPEDLHEAIATLPVWPYATAEITTLARHPITFDNWQ